MLSSAGAHSPKADGFQSQPGLFANPRNGSLPLATERDTARSWVSRMAGRQLKAPQRRTKVPSLAEWLVERDDGTTLVVPSKAGGGLTFKPGEGLPGSPASRALQDGSPSSPGSPRVQAESSMSRATAPTLPSGSRSGARHARKGRQEDVEHLFGTTSGERRRKFHRRLVKGVVNGDVLSGSRPSSRPTSAVSSHGPLDDNHSRRESSLEDLSGVLPSELESELAPCLPIFLSEGNSGGAVAPDNRSPRVPDNAGHSEQMDLALEEATLVLLPRVPAHKKLESGTVATLHTPLNSAPPEFPQDSGATARNRRIPSTAAPGPRQSHIPPRRLQALVGAPQPKPARAADFSTLTNHSVRPATGSIPRAPIMAKPKKASPKDRKWHVRQASLSAALAQRAAQRSGTLAASENATLTTKGDTTNSSDPFCMGAAYDAREYLSFAGWSLDDDYMCTLLCKVEISRMRHINIADNRLTEAAMRLLFEASRMQPLASLQSLRVANNPLGPGGGHILSRVIHDAKPPLQELDMSDCGLGDQACEELCEVLSGCCRNLVGLSLARNGIGLTSNPGVALGSLVAGGSSLQALDVHWNRFHGAGAAALLQGLYDNACVIQGQLWRVNLAWNTIGMRCKMSQNHGKGGGAKAAAEKTQECRCEACRSCAKAVGTLASVLSDGKALFHLDLSYNSLGMADCGLLAEAIKTNHSLFGLHLTGNEAICDDVGFIVVSGGDVGEKLQQREAIRSGINSSVRHTPRCFRLERLDNFKPPQQSLSKSGHGRPDEARPVNMGNLQSSPSLLNLTGSEPFSAEDVEVEKAWAEERGKVQRPMDFGNSRNFEDARMNERCCWICENWVQETIAYIPGWSNTETSLDGVNEIFVYFSIDGFQRPTRLSKITEKYHERAFVAGEPAGANWNSRRRMLCNRSGSEINADLVRSLPDGDARKPLLDEHGRYIMFKGSRMLPPSLVPIKLVFQVNNAIVCADNLLKEDLPEPVTVTLHHDGRNPGDNSANLPPVPTAHDSNVTPVQVTEANIICVGISAAQRFERAQANALCLMEDPRQRGDLEVVPRRTQCDRVLRVRQVWTYETSVFKDYHRENPKVFEECFDHDFSASKLEKYCARYLKGKGVVNHICSYLRKHYHQIMAAFHRRSFQGFTLTRCSAGLSLLQFTEILTQKSTHAEPEPATKAEHHADDHAQPNMSNKRSSSSNGRPPSQQLHRPSSTGSSQQLHHIDRHGPVFNDHFLRSNADTVFIIANVVDKCNKMMKDMSAMPGTGLARFQFLEAFVRLALARFHETNEKETADLAVKELVKVLNVGCQPHHWRVTLQKALFVEECCMLIRQNMQILEEVYAEYSKRLHFQSKIPSKRLTYSAWLEFLQACHADAFGINILNYGVAFAIGKEIRVDEFKSYRHMELSFSEFLVCIGAVVRLAGDFRGEENFADRLLEFIEEYIPKALQHVGGGKANQGGSDPAFAKIVTLVGNVFMQADEDCSGFLSFKEFNAVARQRDILQSFKDLGVSADDFKVLFKMIDSDRSGTVTLDELIDGLVQMRKTMIGLERGIAFLRHAFEEADRDHSGTLSKEEFQAMLKSSAVQTRLQAIDISVEDLDDLWAAVDAADANGDAVVSPDEMIAGLIQIRDEGNALTLGLNFLRQVFKEADIDNDGVLSHDEIRQAFYKEEVTAKLDRLKLHVPDWEGMFHVLDLNADEELSWDELSKGISSVWEAHSLLEASPAGHVVADGALEAEADDDEFPPAPIVASVEDDSLAAE